jgi:drug/metabolite transporter (DMT)-like permease
MISKRNATLIGLIAVFLWSSIVGLIRSVSDSLGATGGAAMIYSVASVFLLLSVGFPKILEFPKHYLIWGVFYSSLTRCAWHYRLDMPIVTGKP